MEAWDRLSHFNAKKLYLLKAGENPNRTISKTELVTISFHLAHLLLDALQDRVRANDTLDYIFSQVERPFLQEFLNLGFLGMRTFLVL